MLMLMFIHLEQDTFVLPLTRRHLLWRGGTELR